MDPCVAQPLIEFLYIYIICEVSSGRVGPPVFKLNHHPQPPSKYIGDSETSQEVYLNKFLACCRALGYNGINKGE
jgi:hypothetical protein